MSKSQSNRREFLARAAEWGAALAAAPHVLAAGAVAADKARLGPWQIGCYTRPWAAFDYRVAMDAIAQAGFKHVGLMSTNSKSKRVISVETTLEEAAEIGREARHRGLGIPSVSPGAFPVQQSLEAGIQGLRHLIDACAAAAGQSLLCNGVGSEKLFADYYKAIAECCDYAAEKHVVLAVKPHGGLNATGPQLRKIADTVGKKNLTVWYDAGNVLYYSDGKINPVDDAAAVDGLVAGWCIKDFIGDPKKNIALTPGTGQIDFKAVLARLQQGGFTRGPLVVECLTPGEPPKLLEEARKAREFLENLVK